MLVNYVGLLVQELASIFRRFLYCPYYNRKFSFSFGGIDEGLGFITFEGFFFNNSGFNSWESVETVEKFMLMGSLGDSWDGEKLLLSVNHGFDALSDEWDFDVYSEFLNFIEGLFLSGGDLVWDKDLSRVALEVLSDVWFFNGDSVWNFFPISLLEDVLNLVCFLFILSDSDLA